jgi:predicted O-methyltransferase YrrM
LNSPTKQQVVERLVAEEPAFHLLDGKEQVWHASPATLAFIAAAVGEGDRTAETGAGASTVVFAATGARHTTISPEDYEHRLILRYCQSTNVATDRLEFVTGSSEEVLPSSSSLGPLDLAFIDGKHSFPHPILDWHYLGAHLRVGGTMLMDDVRAVGVQMLVRIMLADEAWRLRATFDGEAAAFEKLSDPAPGDPWLDQKIAPASAIEQHFGFAPAV